MSRSPYFFVERFDKNTGKYELQHPIVWNWNHTKQVTADLFPYNGCHDLFSIVEEHPDCFPEMKGIHRGLPDGISEDIQKVYNEHCWEDSNTKYEPTVRWFTYADMYIYCLENPEATDYEAMDEAHYNGTEENPPKRIMMPTPMMTLKKRVDAFMEIMDGWDWTNDYSLIRIVYWIDW